jgi:hypothetical protein
MQKTLKEKSTSGISAVGRQTSVMEAPVLSSSGRENHHLQGVLDRQATDLHLVLVLPVSEGR